MKHTFSSAQSDPTFKSGIGLLFSGILDWAYPPVCIGCNGTSLNVTPVCVQCLSKLERPDASIMWSELREFPALLPQEPIFALWQFDAGGIVQRLQHSLKYGNAPKLGIILGNYIGKSFQKSISFRPDILIPVPLAKRRYLERGYNQSEMLARGIAQELCVPCDSGVLIRERSTRSQTTLNRTSRWSNVSIAFGLGDRNILDSIESVLLVDDVFTTGATLVAAAQPLLQQGKRVGFATLAFAR